MATLSEIIRGKTDTSGLGTPKEPERNPDQCAICSRNRETNITKHIPGEHEGMGPIKVIALCLTCITGTN